MLSTDPRADLRTWIEEEGAFTLDSINPSAQEEIARGHGEDGSSGVSMYADVRRGMPAYTFLTTTVACLCTEGDRRNLMEANGYSFESSVASLSLSLPFSLQNRTEIVSVFVSSAFESPFLSIR